MILGFVTGLTAEARLIGDLGRVAAGGGTPAGAARAASALLARGATCLISFGLAGGLDPALRPGAVIVPREVLDGVRFATDPALNTGLGGVSHELLAARVQIVQSADAKRALFEATGARAVDLESGAVARVAVASGVPFAVLRAICDPAECSLPPAALIALDHVGAIGIVRVLRSLAGRPGQLPALLGLARDAARARRALVGRLDDIRRRGGLVG